MGIDVARAANITAILITTSHDSSYFENADYIINDLIEVIEILNNVEK